MEIIEKLKQTKQATLNYFELSASDLAKVYGEGKWSNRYLLVHIVDAETVLYDRIKRIIAEQPRPVLWAFDQDSWASHLDYDTFPFETCKIIFSGIRDAIIHLASKYYLSHGDLTFIHSSMGLRTLKDEIDKVAWHCEHHLKQIEQALEYKSNT